MPATIGDYEVLGTIGSGSFGTCKKIRRTKDAKLLVWKEIYYGDMSEDEKQLLVSEVNLLRELRHPNIVRYYDRIVDRAHSKLYIIMEYCPGGDLASLIEKKQKSGEYFEEAFVWRVFIQLVKALHECHKCQGQRTVLHRDLKPANVFLDEANNAKLGDFGLARVLEHETSFAKTFVGTPYYMSPEQVNYMCYNEKSDIWSLGCLVYEMCALYPPFTASSQKALANRICLGSYLRIPLRYSRELSEVIDFLLQVDHTKRPGILDLMKHPSVAKRLSEKLNTSDLDSTDSRPSLSISLEQEVELARRDAELKRRESELETREKTLQRKEKDLDARQQSLEEERSYAKLLIDKYRNLLKDENRRLSSDCSSQPSTAATTNSTVSSEKSKAVLLTDYGNARLPAPAREKKPQPQQERMRRVYEARLHAAVMKPIEQAERVRSRQILAFR